ncbi:MAG: hypothetical protein J7L37_09915 [Thermococcus sp.]|nr:hypothetical protein [Thermococcus sp.]
MAGPCFRTEVEKIEVLNTIISGVFLGLAISGVVGLLGHIDVSLLHISASILLITPLLF